MWSYECFELLGECLPRHFCGNRHSWIIRTGVPCPADGTRCISRNPIAYLPLIIRRLSHPNVFPCSFRIALPLSSTQPVSPRAFHRPVSPTGKGSKGAEVILAYYDRARQKGPCISHSDRHAVTSGKLDAKAQARQYTGGQCV